MNLFAHNKAYRVLTLSSAIDTFGSSLYNLVFMVYASKLPHATLLISLVTIVDIIPGLLNILTGTFADRTSAKLKMFTWIKYWQSGLFVILTVLIDSRSLIVFFIICLINIFSDLLGQYGNGLKLPLLKSNVADTHLNEAFSTTQGILITMSIVGQTAGTVLLTSLNDDFRLVGIVNALLFLSAGLLVTFNLSSIKPSKSKTNSVQPNEKKNKISISQALTYVRSSLKNNGEKNALFSILISVAINFAGVAVVPLMALLFLKDTALLGLSYGASLAVVNCTYLIGVVCGSFIQRDFFKKMHLSTLLIFCNLMLVLLCSTIVFFQNKFLIISFLFVLAYVTSKSNPKLSALLVKDLPEENLAQIMGGVNTLFTIAAPLGTIVFIALANIASVPIAFEAIAVVTGLLAIIQASVVIKDKLKAPQND